MDDVASQDLEGDYVALLNFSQASKGGTPSREAQTPSGCPLGALEELSGSGEIPVSSMVLPLSGASEGLSLGKCACAKPESMEEGPCIWGLKGKVNHKATSHISECQSQEPHLNVLENPLHCASGLGAGVSQHPAASKTQEPLGNPENIVQLRPEPKQASSPCLCPAPPPAAPALKTKIGKRTKQGNGRSLQSVTNTTSSRAPTPGFKFSFLKGQRQGPVPPEKALLQHDGPWKVLFSLYSPKPNRAKCLGKGKVPTHSAGKGNCSLDEIRPTWAGCVSSVWSTGWHIKKLEVFWVWS